MYSRVPQSHIINHTPFLRHIHQTNIPKSHAKELQTPELKESAMHMQPSAFGAAWSSGGRLVPTLWFVLCEA